MFTNFWIGTYSFFCLKGFSAVWSYTSQGAQCGVTTSYGCCVCDYHISLQLFSLSCPSMPTLCLKDP